MESILFQMSSLLLRMASSKRLRKWGAMATTFSSGTLGGEVSEVDLLGVRERTYPVRFSMSVVRRVTRGTLCLFPEAGELMKIVLFLSVM